VPVTVSHRNLLQRNPFRLLLARGRKTRGAAGRRQHGVDFAAAAAGRTDSDAVKRRCVCVLARLWNVHRRPPRGCADARSRLRVGQRQGGADAVGRQPAEICIAGEIGDRPSELPGPQGSGKRETPLSAARALLCPAPALHPPARADGVRGRCAEVHTCVNPVQPDVPDYPRAFFYPLRPWGAPVSAYPKERLRGHHVMLAWELFTFAFVLYVMVEVPYRVAFAVNLAEQDYVPVCQSTWKIGFDIASCLVFVVDIVVQFHAAQFIGNVSSGQLELVDRLSDIRVAYLSDFSPFGRSFFWDLTCCFPFLQVSCAVYFRGQDELAKGSDTYWDWRAAWQVVHFIGWFFRTLKLWRFWKLGESSEAAARRSPNVANVLTLAQLVFILFFAAHYLGCMWFAVGSPRPDSEDFESSWTYLEGAIWMENDDGTFTRRVQARDDGWLYEWLTAIYWAVTTMTTIGYGDISAHNDIERIYCMFAMALGSAYFAWLAGTVTGILAKGSAGTERFLGFLDEVRQFMDIKRFSEEVKNMVFVFYGLKYPTQLIFNDQEILESLPKGLRKRMQAETYMQTIENIPLFAGLSESVKVEVCNGFETYYCSKQEELCTEDEEPDSLFVVSNGDVLLTHK